MGHGHEQPFKIPHYTEYSNYSHIPELVEHQKRLAQVGLKDPWIRNAVYMYGPGYIPLKKQGSHFKKLIMCGWKGGVGLAAVLIAIEEGYMYMKHGHTSWNAQH